MSLFAELKRRNVFRVGAAYLALGWVITQVTATVVPVLNLPAVIVPIVVWIGVIGFPCVVVFSWVYELTPEGLKREHEVERSESITHETARRLDLLTIGFVIFGALLAVLQQVRAPPAVSTVQQPAAGNSVAPAQDSTVGAGPARDSSSNADNRAQGALPPSIAVLPFVNMSEEASNEFFADGVSEELLNLLAKIPELRVIARTSSFSFKGKDVDVATIAQKLDVAHVLEGSVRRSGNRVRITAQLIRASDSSHLWSETYDRELDDIFAVQGEIAGVVVDQLKITLLGAAPQPKKIDADAFTLFLQARQQARLVTSEGLERSIALYQRVLEIDPGYADAWVELGRTYLNQAMARLRPAEEGTRLAGEALDHALALDPDNAFALTMRGRIRLTQDNDLAEAARLFERALELAPTNPDVLGNSVPLVTALDRQELSLAMEERALQLDPLNPVRHNNLGLDLMGAGRPDQAVGSFRRALALSPQFVGTRSALGMALMRTGDAQAGLAAAREEPSEPSRLMSVAIIQNALGQASESDATLAQLIERHGDRHCTVIAAVYTWRGEADKAFEWLERALERNESGLREAAPRRLFEKLFTDPRWLPFLRRIGRAPEQLEAIRFEVELPEH